MSEDPPTPSVYTVPDAVQAFGLDRTRFHKEMPAGRIEARKAGRRTLILAGGLASFLAAFQTPATRPSGAEHLHLFGADGATELSFELTVRVGGGAVLFGLPTEHEGRPRPPARAPDAGRAPSRPRRMAAGGRS